MLIQWFWVNVTTKALLFDDFDSMLLQKLELSGVVKIVTKIAAGWHSTKNYDLKNETQC